MGHYFSRFTRDKPRMPLPGKAPMRIIAAAFAVFAYSLPASAATLRAEYTLSLAGFTLGQAKLKAAIEGSRYTIQADAKLTGLGAVTGGGKGGANAEGTLGGARPVPAAFTVSGRSGSEQRRLQMGLAAGNVSDIEIVPPFSPKADRVPLEEVHKRGIVDPLSSILMPVQGTGDPLDPSTCNRTIPVFDGAARFNVVLSFAEKKRVKKPGYEGPVLVCHVRYVPVAGHRALRPATKFMQENRDMQVWLAPVAGTRVVLPIRIAIMSMYGMSLVEAESWSVDAGSTASAGAPRTP